jgi:hypothetical protein
VRVFNCQERTINNGQQMRVRMRGKSNLGGSCRDYAQLKAYSPAARARKWRSPRPSCAHMKVFVGWMNMRYDADGLSRVLMAFDRTYRKASWSKTTKC